MTRHEKLKMMSATELAEYLDRVFYHTDDTPWFTHFYQNYCKKCALVSTDGMNDVCYCEVEKSKCRLLGNYPSDADMVKMWLDEEVAE